LVTVVGGYLAVLLLLVRERERARESERERERDLVHWAARNGEQIPALLHTYFNCKY